ncbi:MAG: helix-turn-helix transcriptional regulator, partial [Clostridia bacterium]|nr:helix-turn-helix transcriptional regulator [Clostridia bacterium]
KGIGKPDSQERINDAVDIINENFKKPFCVVIKDFTMSNEAEKLIAFLKNVASENIKNLTVFILTDKEIGNDFLEMEFNGLCSIIDREVLNFSLYEIKEYMRANGFFINDKRAEEIYELSKGWIFLIKLIKKEYMYSSELKEFPAAQEYSKRILYDRLPSDIKEMVLKLLPVDEFDIEQAKYIIGIKEGYSKIEMLLNSSTVFYKDTEKNMYSMYPILKKALMGEFILSGIEKEYIFEKSAFWMQMKNNYVKSLEFYIKAKNKSKIMGLIEKVKITADKELLNVLKNVFEFLGNDKYRCGKKYLMYIVFYSFVVDRQFEKEEYKKAKEYYLSQYEISNYARSEEAKEHINKNFLGLLYFVGCLIEFNKAERMLSYAKEAFTHYEDKLLDNDEDKPDFVFNTYSPVLLFYNSPGTLAQSANMIMETLNICSYCMFGYETGIDLLIQSDLMLVRGDYTNVERITRKAIFKTKLNKNYPVMLGSMFVLLRLYILTRTKKDCDKVIGEIIKIKKSKKVCESVVDLMLGYYYSFTGETENIAQWIRESDLDGCELPVTLKKISYIIMGFSLITEKKYLELEVFSEMMREEYQKVEHYALGIIYSYIFSSISSYRNGAIEKATESLARAINLSEFDEVVEPFIELSSFIIPMLEVIAVKNRFAKSILGNCKASKTIYEEKRIEEYNFTDREKQVIILMINGYKQSEIAVKLYISLPTVKKHAQNIYKKLGVSIKSDAIKILKDYF